MTGCRRHGGRRAGGLPGLRLATWPRPASWPTSPPGSPSATPGPTSSRPTSCQTAWSGLSPKILSREAARRRLAEARRRGQKVVFTNGCFDILHAGHLASLEGAKRLGDLLVVGPELRRLGPRPQGGLPPGDRRRSNRASLLAGLACVDLVVDLRRADPRGADRLLEPDVLVKGETTRSTRSPGRTSCAAAAAGSSPYHWSRV